MNNNIAADLIKGVRSGEHTVESFTRKLNNNQKSEMGVTSVIEAKILECQTPLGNKYLETFNRTRQQKLGIEDKVEVFSEEEVKAIEDHRENFAQTASQSGTGATKLDGIIATTLTPLLDKYFFESPILKSVDLLTENADSSKITDITNDRTADKTSELSSKTATDDTTVVDTITPDIRISDKKEMSHLLKEILDPRDAALNIARMERAVRNQISSMLIGNLANDTDGNLEFYSILNSKAATGNNRGSIPVAVTGVGVENHVDAINYVIGKLPITTFEEMASIKVVCNFTTANAIMRTLDANNNYYFDQQSRTTRHLLTGSAIIIDNNLADNQVGVWDLFNCKVKLLRGPRLMLDSDPDKVTMTLDTYGDASISMAYKATPAKNGFRHFTLETDGDYSS